MVEYIDLYLPKSERYIKLELSVPRNKDGVIFDTLYMLDGQNAFKDSNSAFGRSLRATKLLSFVAKEMGKRILGVAVYNSGSDLGRINEYSPFKIINKAYDDWNMQNLNDFNNYCYDFIHTIVPYIDEHYNTYKDKNHRFIYGSSLAAVTALYLAHEFKDVFNYVGAFSTATFLFRDEMFKFLDKNKDKKKNIFLYVGKKESSDNSYDENIYLNSAYELYNYFKNNKYRVRLSIDPNGVHNEETWGNHLPEFINFIYNEDIFYTFK